MPIFGRYTEVNLSFDHSANSFSRFLITSVSSKSCGFLEMFRRELICLFPWLTRNWYNPSVVPWYVVSSFIPFHKLNANLSSTTRSPIFCRMLIYSLWGDTKYTQQSRHITPKIFSSLRVSSISRSMMTQLPVFCFTALVISVTTPIRVAVICFFVLRWRLFPNPANLNILLLSIIIIIF